MLKKYVAILLASVSLVSGTAYAATSSEIQTEIDGYKEELSQSEKTEDELAEEIARVSEECATTYSEIETLNIEKQSYIDSMMVRIAYFYEEEVNNGVLISLLGDGFAEMLDRAEHMSELYQYDSDRLDEYTEIIAETEEKKVELDARVEELEALKAEQEALREELEKTISKKETELEKAKKAEEEAARKAAEKAAEEAKKTPSVSQQGSSGVTSGYTSGGKLTKRKGVVYYNGHRETYYSQRVLPGNGLNIPGRHVEASDGTVRDGDGYICVASSDLAKGTVVETSLGTGKVYDCGCASGTIDIYVDW